MPLVWRQQIGSNGGWHSAVFVPHGVVEIGNSSDVRLVKLLKETFGCISRDKTGLFLMHGSLWIPTWKGDQIFHVQTVRLINSQLFSKQGSWIKTYEVQNNVSGCISVKERASSGCQSSCGAGLEPLRFIDVSNKLKAAMSENEPFNARECLPFTIKRCHLPRRSLKLLVRAA